MATSPIYSWPEPDNTDLVKNGALAIRTMGNAIDTTMGTMVAKTVVDAKGDLIAGTAADTVNRLAVGSNGETLVADSSTSTGLRYTATFPAGKNKIINGDFGIWQRGTSFSLSSSSAFTADRFEGSSGGGGVAVFSRQTFTPGTDPVNGYAGTYYLDANYTTSGTSTIMLENKMEDVTTFANQPVRFSFWGKVSTGTHSVTAEAVQRFGSGGSSAVVAAGAAVTLTTDWQRFNVSISVPAITGKTVGAGSSTSIRLNIGTSGVKTFSIWGWQAEYGSVTTAFQTATGTIQGELAACQRYYWQSPSTVAYTPYGFGLWINATTFQALVKLPVSMRIIPTLATSNALAANGSALSALTSVTVVAAQSSVDNAYVSATGTGTANYPAFLINNNTSGGYLGLTAEL